MNWIRRVGLGLLLAWAGFWVWFNMASAIGERSGPGWVGIEVEHLVLAAIIAGVSVVAWRWPIAGCPTLLVLSGCGWWYFGPKPFVIFNLLVPPMVAAVLLMAASLGKTLSLPDNLTHGSGCSQNPGGHPK